MESGLIWGSVASTLGCNCLPAWYLPAQGAWRPRRAHHGVPSCGRVPRSAQSVLHTLFVGCWKKEKSFLLVTPGQHAVPQVSTAILPKQRPLPRPGHVISPSICPSESSWGRQVAGGPLGGIGQKVQTALEACPTAERIVFRNWPGWFLSICLSVKLNGTKCNDAIA